jgi:hypothetical protein
MNNILVGQEREAMNMKPGLRKFALTAHITASVGWLGAVVAYLAVAIAGLTSHDAQAFSVSWSTDEISINMLAHPQRWMVRCAARR